jgi:hypothetical protein
MNQFLKQVVILFLIFFIAEKAVYYFINNAPKKEQDNRLELVLKGEMNKDVIVLGSSRGAHGLDAELLEKKIQKETYNLSFRGSDIVFQEFVLKKLLKYNKAPERILLVIDNIYEFKDNKTLNFRIDRLLPLKNYSGINDELIKRDKKSVLSKILCLSRVSREDFNLKKIKSAPQNQINSHGSILLDPNIKEDFSYINLKTNYSILNENTNKLKAFENIQKLCDEYQVELFYVFPPDLKTFNNSFFKRFKKLVSNERKIIVYDTTDLRYKESRYFKDETHLAKTGASIFTTEISTYLIRKKYVF